MYGNKNKVITVPIRVHLAAHLCIHGVCKLYARLSLANYFAQLNFSIQVQLLRCTLIFGRHSRNDC